ncbi:2'-5' RNA ligase family protein [Mucilaginibacter aquatilis]|uniref:2'-5' RNA ligase family protein n=1 Tax=Mucilaginibacter aquatilis TaxID=1517760 RepID=A0A6I4IEW0_9SPHI|nr:2'-5' RNA ligase family protein [Mucilaginibacter aquatilis]MVN91899.1 2'-5' RNA ligase family protein [Mucilaginibacter aquatilis]
MNDAPLILTLMLDDASQQYFNQLRTAHFPPERNYLDAHLTLFHNLPAHEAQIVKDIEFAAINQTTMQLQIKAVKSIGSGVAFDIECMQLKQLHNYLQQLWQPWLIPQDKQKLWPHITIQNKVTHDAAMLLKAQLENDFESFEATGTGLALFEYRGGPWEFVREFKFGT